MPPAPVILLQLATKISKKLSEGFSHTLNFFKIKVAVNSSYSFNLVEHGVMEKLIGNHQTTSSKIVVVLTNLAVAMVIYYGNKIIITRVLGKEQYFITNN